MTTRISTVMVHFDAEPIAAEIVGDHHGREAYTRIRVGDVTLFPNDRDALDALRIALISVCTELDAERETRRARDTAELHERFSRSAEIRDAAIDELIDESEATS